MDKRSTCLHSGVRHRSVFYLCCYCLVDQVARPGHKKARMARTRADFLTRGSNLPGEGESEEEEYDETPLSIGPPLPKQDSEGGTLDACHSDSEMVIKRPTLPKNRGHLTEPAPTAWFLSTANLQNLLDLLYSPLKELPHCGFHSVHCNLGNIS